MRHRDGDQALTVVEARRIAMERFGFSADDKDYNIYRILDLARKATGALYTSFSVPIRGGSAILALAGADMGTPIQASPLCEKTYAQQDIVVKQQPDLGSWLASVPGASDVVVESYFGVPVFGPDNRVVGSFSLFFGQGGPEANDEIKKVLNDYGRLIEDSLIMRALSIRDPLTQMFNRRYMEQHAKEEWRRAIRLKTPISFAMLDVDYFKAFNDSAGHVAGDSVLIQLAEVINTVCKRAGDAACRYGGEEFALILPMTPANGAEIVVEQMRERFSSLAIANPGKDNAPVTFSAGIITLDNSEALQDLGVLGCFNEADRALYAAKQAGRNTLIHASSL